MNWIRQVTEVSMIFPSNYFTPSLALLCIACMINGTLQFSCSCHAIMFLACYEWTMWLRRSFWVHDCNRVLGNWCCGINYYVYSLHPYAPTKIIIITTTTTVIMMMMMMMFAPSWVTNEDMEDDSNNNDVDDHNDDDDDVCSVLSY